MPCSTLLRGFDRFVKLALPVNYQVALLLIAALTPTSIENTRPMWIEHVLNAKAITSIYPAQVPSLSGVRLHELSIICGGDLQCRLRFDLQNFPADAPPKWVQRECNTVQLALSLTQVIIEQCVIPSGNGIGDLSIVHDGTGFQVAFSTQAQGVVFRAQATWIHVDSISAYLNG